MLREKIEKFQQLLHKGQEREVNSKDLLSESHNKYNELKSMYDGMAGERTSEQLTSELVKIRACKDLKIR